MVDINVLNFGRYPFTLDQELAIRQMFKGDRVTLSKPIQIELKTAEDFANAVNGMVASVIVSAEFILETEVGNLITRDTILLFWGLDDKAKARGRLATNSLRKYTRSEGKWRTREELPVTPTVEVSLRNGTVYEYGTDNGIPE